MAGAMLFTACDDKIPSTSTNQVVQHISTARRTQILYGARHITPGMSRTEVQNALGKPDETTDILAQSGKTGYTLAYILEHPTDTNLQGKLLRLHFDLNDKVTQVEDLTQ
jgi:hypothetical protein